MRFAFGTKLAKFLLHLHLIMHLILALFNLTAEKNKSHGIVLVVGRLGSLHAKKLEDSCIKLIRTAIRLTDANPC
jgi:hypothetical protein